VCVASASAQPFQNGSFELGTPTADPCNIPLAIGSTAITGWTVIEGNIEWLNGPPGCGWVGSNGTWSLDLVGTGNKGGVQQTFDTTPGQTYQVIFDLAGNPSGGFPPAVKNLTVTVDGTPHDYTFDTTGHSPTSMGWTPQSFLFVASGISTTLSFVSDMTGSSFAGAALDNVRVQEINLATPELIRALPAGSAVIPLVIGQVDGASNTPITVRLFGGTTCTNGVLGGTVAQIGTDFLVTTDAAGNFGFGTGPDLPSLAQGQFVAIDVVSPEVTPLSACAVTAADNDSWPKALRLTGDSATVPADWIDVPGRTRWYRFSIAPAQRVQVTLSGVPADYDLAMFKDIAAEFANELEPQNLAQLTRLSAQFAPSAFSPSAFSPSAFSPSAFSPSAFSPSAFSPSAFSPSAFSPSAFSPSAFSPSAFSPSAFSPSAFSPSAFSPSAFSPSAFSDPSSAPSAFSPEELAQAFSSAQTRSIIATSMTAGLGNESVVAHTFNSTGDFYVRVTGRAGVFSATPYTLAISKQGTSCAGVTDTLISTAREAIPGGLNTIVLVDSGNTPLSAVVSSIPLLTLGDKLATLVQRPDVNGTIVDLALDPRVGQLKAQAGSNVACPYAKNLVAEEIKTIVDAYLAGLNPLRHVVIVGNDDAVPFFRYPDRTLLGPESQYVPPVSSSSASEASLRGNFFLGQDAYGAVTHLSLQAGDFPVLGLAVGRLIETPAEIAAMIDAFVEANGTIAPSSSLVTGYDFLQDAAEAIRTELEAGIGPAGTKDSLITPSNVSPASTSPYPSGPWTATNLRQGTLAVPRGLLNARHDVIFLGGHFNANSALAADFKTSILSSEVAELAGSNFKNALVFSAGCHAGYNLVDTDAIFGVTFPLDWAQAFARQKATLVAGTGYQYGDTEFLEYSERLYLNFAKELRAPGNVTLGEALVRAKLRYLAATPDLRALHEKAVLEATLFGLPMMGVNMLVRGVASSTGPVVATTPASAGTPGATLGLQLADRTVSPTLTSKTLILKNFDVQPPTTITATWLEGIPDGVVTHAAEPALPLHVENVTPVTASLVLRGVGFRGGSYADSTVLPLTGAPTTELRGVHTPFGSPFFYPMRLWTINYFNALSEVGGTSLLLTPAQHRALDDTHSTLRQYSSLALRLFYSDLTTETNAAQAAASLADAPSIVRVDAVPSGGFVTFSAQVVGNPAAGMQGVWVTYTNGAGGTGTWTSIDLEQCVTPLPVACGTTKDSRIWKGRAAAASLPADTKYIVQAVNGVGLVSLDDNLGRYYSTGTAAGPAATTIAFAPSPPNPPPPTTAVYGDSKSFTALLTAGGSPLANKLVTIGAGGASRTGTTNAAGLVTIQVPMLSAPGTPSAPATYPVTASFAGVSAFLPSSVSAPSPITVTKAPTTLALAPTVDGRTGAVLTASVGGKTQPLINEWILFLVRGPVGAQQQLVAITDQTGRASIPAPGQPAGTYTVIQACYAGNATFNGSQLNTTPCGLAGFFLHGSGATADPAILFLDRFPPTAQTAMTKDSPAVNFNGGNAWKEIGLWSTTDPKLAKGVLKNLPQGPSKLRVWLGLKNSDDQGTQFDVQAVLKKNGAVVASGITRCITGITRNPNQAKEALVTFNAPAIPPTSFNGTTDVLSLQLLTRIGTNPNDTKCPGPGGSHNNAVGLRLYFNAVPRNSYFDAAPP
jgi:choice-of-anchor C domain-containing protein